MHKIDPDLPDEIQQGQRSDAEQYAQRLQTLSMLIARKRDEAVAARAASGIEKEWIEDEEAYEGIDDANRTEARIIKPMTNEGGLQRSTTGKTTRSTVFLNITRPYVDSAAARVGDMLLPTDDRAFAIKPEPIPEMTNLKGDMGPATGPDGQPIMIPGPVQPAAPGQPAAAPTMVPATSHDMATKVIEEATKSVEAAQKRIDDWLVECQYHQEKRQMIHDCARIGTGILKGPFPVKRKATVVNRKGNGVEIITQEDIKPASKRIDVWNFYPDGDCGENIHNGNHCLEQDFLTERQLRDLKGVPGYLDEQIEACIKEGPQKANEQSSGRPSDRTTAEKTRFHIWYFYGTIKSEDMELLDPTLLEDQDFDPDRETQYAIVTMVNDRIIKGALNPLDSGEFPYDVLPWQTRAGTWCGIGVGRQMRAPQGIVNAGTRNMMDNAALSGGPQLIINREFIKPADGDWTITPRKIWTTINDATPEDIRKAMVAIDIPSKQQELMAIVEFAMKMAEQTTGMPMLLQGQTGAAPDTLGGQLLANNNASTTLRRIARLDDDCITEPHIRRYYEYLLLYGPEESEKGNFTVDARGSSALVERDIQNHAALAMLPLSKDPAYGLDPKKAAEEALKAQRLDPKRFQYTEEELAKMQQQPPPEAPAVTAAKITAQSREKIAQQVSTQKVELSKLDTDRDTAYNDSLARRDEIARQKAIEDHDRAMQLETLKYANLRQISIDEAKVQLATVAMKLDVTKDLALAGHVKAIHKHNTPPPISPVIEPAGRAPDSESFQA